MSESKCISRLLILASLVLGPAIVSAYAAGTVVLANVSKPYTGIEVSNTVSITINGAAAFGTVAVSQNGGPVTVWPGQPNTTDGSGHWFVSSVETTGNIGNYTQTWYVNGVPMTPVNLDRALFPDAPSLPSFTVHNTQLKSNPPVLVVVNACGGPQNVTAKWVWNPVSYQFNTSYGASVVSAAVGRWNTAQGKINIQSSSTIADILVGDGTLPPNTYGGTYLYSQACDSSCYRHTDLCTGVCFNSQAIFYSDIILNSSLINNLATASGIASSTVATHVLTHELGHNLGLGDLNPSYGVCSEVGSLMVTMLGMFCGVSNPTSRDINVFNTVYSVAPPTESCGYTVHSCYPNAPLCQ